MFVSSPSRSTTRELLLDASLLGLAATTGLRVGGFGRSCLSAKPGSGILPAMGVILPGALALLSLDVWVCLGAGVTSWLRLELEVPGCFVRTRLPRKSGPSSKLDGKGKELPEDRRGRGSFCILPASLAARFASDMAVLEDELLTGDAAVKCAGFFATGGAGLFFAEL